MDYRPLEKLRTQSYITECTRLLHFFFVGPDGTTIAYCYSESVIISDAG